MILPPPTFFICSIASLENRIAAKNLRSRSCCQTSSSTVSKLLALDVPALFTRISILPNLVMHDSTTFFMSSGFVTSAEIPIISPLAVALISFTALSRSSCLLAQITTLAPSSHIILADAFPIPSLPPVIIAALPVNSKSIIYLFVSYCIE